jgi:hypothetical protein
MLRLLTVLTAIVALGGLAATTQPPLTDTGNQRSAETSDRSQPSGTKSYSSQSRNPLDSPAYSQSYRASAAYAYFYEGTAWIRRVFWSRYSEKEREAERREREVEHREHEARMASLDPHETGLHSEDPLHPRQQFNREDPFHRGTQREDPFHPGTLREDPLHPGTQREDPFHPGAQREDPFHPGTQREDPLHPGTQAQREDPSHRGTQSNYQSPLAQTENHPAYQSPLSQPARSASTAQVRRNAPPVQHAPPPPQPQQGLNH